MERKGEEWKRKKEKRREETDDASLVSYEPSKKHIPIRPRD